MQTAVLFFTLSLAGCGGCGRPNINESAVMDNVRQADPQLAKLHEVFPEASTTLGWRVTSRMSLTRSEELVYEVKIDLASSCYLYAMRTVEVGSDGKSVSSLGPRMAFVQSTDLGSYIDTGRVAISDGGKANLDDKTLDALLAARGDLASLKPFDIDCSLPWMDGEAVLAGIRKSYPEAAKLKEVFPNSSEQVSKRRFGQDGGFYVLATLPHPYKLKVSGKIRVARNGKDVELVEKALPRLENHDDHTAGYGASPGDSITSMELSAEQFERIVAAKGATAEVEKVWAQRTPSPKPKPRAHPGPDGKIEEK